MDNAKKNQGKERVVQSPSCDTVLLKGYIYSRQLLNRQIARQETQ